MSYKLTNLKRVIKVAEYEELLNFLSGQTSGLDEEGDILIYEADFKRWLKRKNL